MQVGLLRAHLPQFKYFPPYKVNIRKMIPLLVDPETDDIIFINSAKKFNDSASQCLIGLSFSDCDAKDKFEERVKSYHYKLRVLQANDPLLKILLWIPSFYSQTLSLFLLLMGQQYLLKYNWVGLEFPARVDHCHVSFRFVQYFGAKSLVPLENHPIHQGSDGQDKSILTYQFNYNSVFMNFGSSSCISAKILFFLPFTSWNTKTFFIYTTFDGRASLLTLITKSLHIWCKIPIGMLMQILSFGLIRSKISLDEAVV